MRWHSEHGMGAYVGAKGLARGRRHAIRPWPDQEAYEGKDGAANETLTIYFWQNCGTNSVCENTFIKIYLPAAKKK